MAGIQILVVEDDPMQAKLVGFLLEEAGHTVRIAGSAEKALEILQSFRPDRMARPDLILMDIQLPGKDGLELTRELRRTPIHDKTPIIALTAYTNVCDLERAREAGCNGIIWKPIDAAAFARQVRNYVGGGDADIPSDGSDLLAEMRNAFLAEGLEQCCAILKDLKSNAGRVTEKVQRVVRRWAGMGKTLGFPEIFEQGRRLEALTIAASLEHDELIRAIETARRRFLAATSHESKLPLALIRGLRDVRIGLAHFSEEEANRLRTVANRSNVRAVMERMNPESADPDGYDAMIVNECALSAQPASNERPWTLPTLFISPRSSLESLSKLSSRAHDFLIAPWEAEEALLRVYRLIASAPPPPPAVDSPHMPRRQPRVLIADDDPDMVALVSATLRRSGLEFNVAHSGLQALDKANRHPPDAIVLDVNMPDLDGFEVLKRLRRNLTTETIPVLMLTARGQESDIARSAGSGADDYVVKPFDPTDLANRLETIIAARALVIGRR